MIRTLIAALLLAPAVGSTVQAQQTLATMVDRNRVLLIFAKGQLDPRYGQQLDLLNHHTAELSARDLVVLPVVSQEGPPQTAEVLRLLRPPMLSAEEQITIRRRFHLGPTDFAVILLGKDGGEKLRSKTPITVARLNRTIDAMPMRQQEMRSQH